MNDRKFFRDEDALARTIRNIMSDLVDAGRFDEARLPALLAAWRQLMAKNGYYEEVNVQMTTAIGYRRTQTSGGPIAGFVVEPAGHLISDIICVLETSEIPNDLKQVFPGLTIVQWQQVLRFLVLFFGLFEVRWREDWMRASDELIDSPDQS